MSRVDRELRKRLKFWFGNSFPTTRGQFSYFGTNVYFPVGHELFRRVCETGVYEADVLNFMAKHLNDDGLVYDVGANIGLSVLPLIRMKPLLKVVSFEPSPNSIPYLKRTIAESSYNGRWKLQETAVGEESGATRFCINSNANGAFDGRGATGRAGATDSIEVPLISLDQFWTDSGKPAVCMIKIDVEGFETEVLRGAARCLKECRPIVVLEWSLLNLKALGRKNQELLTIATELGFEVFAIPSLSSVGTEASLELQMKYTESFVLYPQPTGVR